MRASCCVRAACGGGLALSAKTVATNLVVSALLGSPRGGEALAPSFCFAAGGGGREMIMVSTSLSSNSRGGILIPTSGSTSSVGRGSAARIFNPPRENPHNQKQRAAAPPLPPAPCSTTAPFCSPKKPVAVRGAAAAGAAQAQRQQRHPRPPALPKAGEALFFADEADPASSPLWSSAGGLPGRSAPHGSKFLQPRLPPELRRELAQSGAGDALRPAYGAAVGGPWLHRVRHPAYRSVLSSGDGPRAEVTVRGGAGRGDGSGGAMMRKRALEKAEVLALRKESKKRAIGCAALPLVDLFGILSPLVLIVGISIAQYVP